MHPTHPRHCVNRVLQLYFNLLEAMVGSQAALSVYLTSGVKRLDSAAHLGLLVLVLEQLAPWNQVTPPSHSVQYHDPHLPSDSRTR